MTSRARAAVLGVCVALRFVSLVRPCLSDDEAIYCVVAREMLAGRLLYRDVVDHKPPLIYVTYALTQAVGGPIIGMLLLHLLTILVVFATALLLADVTRKIWPGVDEPQAPFVAALLYAVFSTTLVDVDALAANCELFMLLPLTASVDLYLRGAPELRPRLLMASGALVALAMLYKYQAAVHLPLYAAHLAWTQRQRPRRTLAACAAIGAGALGVAIASTSLMAVTGCLGPALSWFRFNFAYIKQGLAPLEVLGRAAVRVSFVVAVGSFLWVLGLGGASRALKSAVRSATAEAARSWFVVGWLVVSLAAVSVGGRFFGHYFHQATAPLAVLAAPAAAGLWRRRRPLVLAWAGIPAVAFLLLGALHTQVMAAVGEPDPDYAAIARFVRASSTPRERLVVWGNSPVLYFEANRPLGSRFVFSNYMTGLSPATRTQSDPTADASANVVPESWDMFEHDLQERKPALFVDMSPGNLDGYGKFPPSRFPRLDAILRRDYLPLGEIAGARVLRRRTQSE